jgi:hypothetical protein
MKSVPEIQKTIEQDNRISKEAKETIESDIKSISKQYSKRKLGKPTLLPQDVKISASSQGQKATVEIKGVIPTEVEYYSYEGIKRLGPITNFEINLAEGRRFNFRFLKENIEHYVLLTPEMANNPQYLDFLGENISMDCKDPRGCCFIITARATN